VVFNPVLGSIVNGACRFTNTGSFTASCQVNNVEGPVVITIPLAGGGQVDLLCTPPVGSTTATCNGSFDGTPRIGAQATIALDGLVLATGVVVAGAVVFPTPIAAVTLVVPPAIPPPLLPPVPPLPILPPPPPLLPAPPLALQPAPASEVPVIPEGESLLLLAIGLAAFGATLRLRRRSR
jgi:hypothetical protein